MNQEPTLIPQRMRTPRAAAIAGIVFSLLFITSLLLVWVSIPADPLVPASAVLNHLKAISFSLNLLPFAGIAFLWFIAVVRDRLGELEDRFFATVFLGSGLLFIAMVF
jgi:membrane protein DedA with SNARE-associated domain